MLPASTVPCVARLDAKPGSDVARPDWTLFWLILVLLMVPPTFTVWAAPLRLKPLSTLPPTSAPDPLFKFLMPPVTLPTTVRPACPVVEVAGVLIW